MLEDAPTSPTPKMYCGAQERTKNLTRLALLCGMFAVQAHALSSDLTGSWGGEHIRLDIAEAGAKVEFDCAFGTIDEPLVPDEKGAFVVLGTHAYESGGGRQPGELALKGSPASYRGWTDGSEMRLTVTLIDTGRVVGTFSLRQGRPPVLEKCG